MNNDNNPKDSNNKNGENKSNRNGFIAAIIATLLIFVFIIWIREEVVQGTQKEITYDTFLDMVEDGKVKSVEFSNNTIQITPKNEKDNPLYSISMYYTGYVNDEELVETLKEAGVEFKSTIDDGSGSIIEFLMWNVVPFIFIFGITW